MERLYQAKRQIILHTFSIFQADPNPPPPPLPPSPSPLLSLFSRVVRLGLDTKIFFFVFVIEESSPASEWRRSDGQAVHSNTMVNTMIPRQKFSDRVCRFKEFRCGKDFRELWEREEKHIEASSSIDSWNNKLRLPWPHHSPLLSWQIYGSETCLHPRQVFISPKATPVLAGN